MRVRIEKMLYGGSARGRPLEAGRAAMNVPFCLPGELVDAAPPKTAEGIGEAMLEEVVEPSEERVAAGCVHFGVCGGCQYQHASYVAQLDVKRGILRDVLAAAGVSNLPEIEVHSGPEWGYRNRIRLRADRGGGELRLGYNRRATNEFLPIQECPIAAPVLWRAAMELLRLAQEDVAARRWLEAVSEVEIFANADEGRLQMAFSLLDVEPLRAAGALVASSAAGFATFCERLRERLPELTGAGAEMDAELGRRTRRGWTPAAWGAAGLSYEAAGGQYWVTRGAFFQVNRFLVNELARVALEGRTGELAWDLYAGVGLFSRVLARGFGRVVAVEAGEPAAGDLARILAKAGPGHKAERATTVEYLRGAVLQRERPELILMDPPRAGMGAEVCSLLLRIAPAELVYVSCDPVTLARDLAGLVKGGYGLREVHLVDLFPQTFHMETVVVLGRGTT